MTSTSTPYARRVDVGVQIPRGADVVCALAAKLEPRLAVHDKVLALLVEAAPVVRVNAQRRVAAIAGKISQRQSTNHTQLNRRWQVLCAHHYTPKFQ